MVTLDISDSYIKFLVVKGKTIDRAVSLPLEPGLVKDGVVENPTVVAERIRQVMSAHNIPEKHVDVCLSGIHSIYRIVSLPKVSNNVIDEAVRREMERVMPVPLDEVYMSWRTLTVTSIDMTVCVLGIPRNTIDALMTTLRQAGLDSKFIMVRPMALAKLTDESNAIVIDIQPTGFDIALVVDGVPDLLRDMVFPSRDMPDDQKVATVLEELERTVSFYNAAPNHVALTRDIATFITGELGAMLSSALKYRLKPVPKLLAYPADFNDSAYAANIGLVLARLENGSSPVRITMNVLPQVYIPRMRAGAFAGWGLVIIAAVALAMFAYATYQEVNKTAALQAQVNVVQLQVDRIKGSSEAIKKLQTQQDEIKATLALYRQPLDAARAQQAKVNGDLASVTRLLPGTVNPKSIIYGASLVITGVAPDKATILSYVRDLRDTYSFTSVILSNMSEVEYNKWDFTLTLK